MIVEARIHNPDLMGFFIALNWLKSYKTEENMAITFRLAKKTIRTKAWRYAGTIWELKSQKVSATTSSRTSIELLFLTLLVLSFADCFW
jgi:hypothetical protein